MSQYSTRRAVGRSRPRPSAQRPRQRWCRRA